MRQFRHWTPRYVYHRLGMMRYERAHPDSPWLVPRVVEILDSWLKPTDRGLEWGSGRSTCWFARRVQSLVSVEHSPEWYSRVSAALNSSHLLNVDYHLCESERDYLSAGAKFPPETFDFCLVDGIARDECARSAISLLKPGGILIIDNCNCYLPSRSRSPFSRKPDQGPYNSGWAAYLNEVESWRQIWTSNGVFDTALWLKPSPARECAELMSRSDHLFLQSI